MADLNQLKQKYAPVVETIQQFSSLGATVETPTLSGDKLLLKGTCHPPSSRIACGM